MQLVDSKKNQLSTIDKTLLTANLMGGFWDRWIVHGVDKDDINLIRKQYMTKERWNLVWQELAYQKYSEAEKLSRKNLIEEAELKYREAGLYYQLIYWLIPERNNEKLEWLNQSLIAFQHADQQSLVKTEYVQLYVDHQACFGRVRIPKSPKAVIIIINPLDSTKEELFSYENDFVENDIVVISFDGPGQGQTYTNQGLRGSRKRWETFIDSVIDYACTHFSKLSIHLFGTSSGAAWALYGSCNQKVSKVVAISPAFNTGKIKLPDYFMERTQYVLKEENVLPDYEKLAYQAPIMLVHGKQDVMVSDEDIHSLYTKLPNGKCYLEYEEEGHCCNYKLPEIRKLAMEWLERG
jgi:hypothetical protein